MAERPMAGGWARVAAEAERELADAGLTGWFCVRDLGTGHEVSLRADDRVAVASLVKVPLALIVLERIADGDLDASEPVDVPPPTEPMPGLTGLSRFRHPARVSLEDLVLLSTTLSDNVAADLLFDRVSPEQVSAWLRRRGLGDLVVRHPIGDLADTPMAGEPAASDLAHVLAIEGSTGRPGAHGHRVRQLDPSRASTGTARVLTDLLAQLWADDGPAARRVRELMGEALHRQRLWPDFASDASRWHGKTGTLLNLRHEMGVVEHADGTSIAVVALTASQVPAAVQPHAEMTIGSVARRLHDVVRDQLS